MNKIPQLHDITEASERIKPFIHRTPILTSLSINKITDASVYFKCENFQKVGAFKFRGATNAVLLLNYQDKKQGVATHSSGNHAAALALAAKNMGIKAYVVMPENAPIIKKRAVESYGAEITFCKPSLSARESSLNKLIEKTGAKFIHPYNNFNIISGQGTAAIEILEEYADLDIVMAPVGGGGLLSGTATAVKGVNKKIKVIAAEPKNADDAFKSIKAGHIVPSINPNTIADGLLTSLGDLTFRIISEKVDDIVTVSEKGIVEAMRLIWERMKIIIEPSSAVPLAGILEHGQYFSGKKVGVILSGGNVDLNNLPF
ncbi:MAG: serine dehydratase [Bacteroidetes bacterium 4572_117]|nr:MAG: serine dehydratase [Bacteroidetes bacterium 4572_117]